MDQGHVNIGNLAEWPLMRRGIAFWTSKTDQRLIYLIGNPFVWTSVFISLFVYAVFQLKDALYIQRGGFVHYSGFHRNALRQTTFLFIGWLVHYVFFFLMKRQLFLHHYFPSLYFGILLTGALLDMAAFSRPVFLTAASMFGSMVCVACFWVFSFATYGNEITKEQCLSRQWRSKWDFDCNTFK